MSEERDESKEAGDGKRKRRRNSKPVEAAAGPAVGQAGPETVEQFGTFEQAQV